MRNVAAIGLLSVYLVAILLTIGHIGKPREPITPGVAVVSTILSGLFAAAVVYLWLTP